MAEPKEWKPQPDSDGALSQGAAVFQAVGAASVCWESMEGTGVFDEQQAIAIAAGLIEALGIDPDAPVVT